jgi:hypothetical protein
MKSPAAADLLKPPAVADGGFLAVVGSHSMAPALACGARVWVSPCASSQIQAGDVAAYRFRDRVVLHRVVAVHPRFLLLRGDATSVCDLPLKPDELLGRARCPEGGLPTSSFLQAFCLRTVLWTTRISFALGTAVAAMLIVSRRLLRSLARPLGLARTQG